ncbi:hypothetical protein GC176_09375 [bacterium]|nr:hypothetical protein [bacterium]
MLRVLAPLLVSVLAGCSITVGNAASSFQLQSTGIGTTQVEAERDAWHDAAERLHAMGYSTFNLKRTSMSASTSSASGETRVELTAGWNVSAAEKGNGGACRCGLPHRAHSHND